MVSYINGIDIKCICMNELLNILQIWQRNPMIYQTHKSGYFVVV